MFLFLDHNTKYMIICFLSTHILPPFPYGINITYLIIIKFRHSQSSLSILLTVLSDLHYIFNFLTCWYNLLKYGKFKFDCLSSNYKNKKKFFIMLQLCYYVIIE